MQEIGIAIRAKKDLQAILDSVEALGKIDSQTKKVVESVKDLGKGSAEVRKLESAYKKLEKEIEKTGKASKEQLKSWREQQRQLAGTAAGLRISQGMKISDYDIEVKTARANLAAILKRPDLDEETRLSLSTLYRESGILPKIDRTKLAMMEPSFKSVSSRIAQIEGVTDAGDVWRKRMKTAAGLLLGGSIAGFGISTMRHWMDVDRELLKIEKRFNTMRKHVTDIGLGLGLTKKESAEIAKISGEITNEWRRAETGQYVGFARVHGLAPSVGMQLRMSGRYVEIPETRRWLTAFEKFSKDVGMGRGRIGELMDVTSRVAMMAHEAALGQNIFDVMGKQQAAATFWKGIDEERGKGVLGMNFLQRINAGLTNQGGDAQRLFLMRAYDFGKPGVTMIDVMKRIEQGIWGAGPEGKSNLQAVLELLESEYGQKMSFEKFGAAYSIFEGNLKTEEIEKLLEMRRTRPEAYEKFMGELSKKKDIPALMERYGIKPKDFEGLGSRAVAAGDRMKQLLDITQYNMVEPIRGAVKAFRGETEEAKEIFRGIINDLTTPLNQLIPGLDKLTRTNNDLLDRVDELIDMMGRGVSAQQATGTIVIQEIIDKILQGIFNNAKVNK
jgi:hypothetical protein